MIVAVQGTPDFNDYSVFLRAISVAMSGMKEDDKQFIIYSAGPLNINSFVSEFSNISEKGMKARGKKIKFYKVPPAWVEQNIKDIDYLAFLCKPKQRASKLVGAAELNNVEVGIFQY